MEKTTRQTLTKLIFWTSLPFLMIELAIAVGATAEPVVADNGGNIPFVRARGVLRALWVLKSVDQATRTVPIDISVQSDTLTLNFPRKPAVVSVWFFKQKKPGAIAVTTSAVSAVRRHDKVGSVYNYKEGENGPNMDGSISQPHVKFYQFVNGFSLPLHPLDNDDVSLTLSATSQGVWGYLSAHQVQSPVQDVSLEFLSHVDAKFANFLKARVDLVYDPRWSLFLMKKPWKGADKNATGSILRIDLLHAALNRIADTPEAAEKVWRGEVAKLDAATDQELFDWMLAASAEDYHNARTPAAKARAVLLLSIDGPFVAPAYVWKDGKTTRYAVTLENEAKVRLAGFDEKGRFVMGGWADLDANALEKDRWAALGDLLGVDFAHPVPAPATAPATGPTTAPTTGPSTIPTTRVAAATGRPATATVSPGGSAGE